ncbi:expressed unknown protein [Seminavis robusta]|uniref:Uncharacterized protein n=1 Tax=Seminavis robusta TaxID=568900 RepID=A0A9N8DJG7_9STRA|nr:expressed unknown protein [Seminavis robusta]|eukprot:Sro93_g048361.1  (323) ;mRNA; r:30587-31555
MIFRASGLLIRLSPVQQRRMAKFCFSPDPPPNHWSRKGGAFPILVCSPRVEELRRCMQDNSSHLSTLRGVEAALLLLIASFGGLAVLEPCSCCRGESFRYCGTQGRHCLVEDSPQSQQNPNKEFCSRFDYSPLDFMSVCTLDTDDYFYFSEHIQFFHGISSDWKWEERSQKMVDEKGLRAFQNLALSCGSCNGIGYVACSSKGFYSNCLKVEWKDMQNFQITCRRSSNSSGMVRCYYLNFSRTLLDPPSKFTGDERWLSLYQNTEDGKKRLDADMQAELDLNLKIVPIKTKKYRFRLSPSACLSVTKAVLAQGLKMKWSVNP